MDEMSRNCSHALAAMATIACMSPASRPPAPGVVTLELKAMGMDVRLSLADAHSPGPARTAVETLLSQADATFSRFRGDSELQRLQAGRGRAAPVSPLLRAAVSASLRAARLSAGLVDPTVGAALRAGGYDRDFASIEDGADVSGIPVPGWELIELDGSTGILTIPAGVELDLGATGKALLVDMCAVAALAAGGASGAAVSIGGDIAVAGTAPDGGWSVRIDDGPGQGAVTETVAVFQGGMATSSTVVRRWSRGGRSWHHIIDPATGLPAAPHWRTVSVVAETCVDANTAATAAVVLGPAAIGWLRERALAARLIDNSGQVQFLGGWPAPG
jgi:thiamine biosynthesis lipoprotein